MYCSRRMQKILSVRESGRWNRTRPSAPVVPFRRRADASRPRNNHINCLSIGAPFSPLTTRTEMSVPRHVAPVASNRTMPARIRVRPLMLNAPICGTLIRLNWTLENEASPGLGDPVQRIERSSAVIVGLDAIRGVYIMPVIGAEETSERRQRSTSLSEGGGHASDGGAKCANRLRSVSYARNSSDFSAGIEQSSTSAICA